MLGFKSVSDDLISDAVQRSPTVDMTGIHQININLRNFRAIHEIMDSWLVLEVDDQRVVYQWRLEAEHRMQREQAERIVNSGNTDLNPKSSLSDEQIYDFVNRFMPAYMLYLPQLYSYGPERRCPTATDADSSASFPIESSNLESLITRLIDDKVSLVHQNSNPSVLQIKISRDRTPVQARIYK